MSYLSLTLYGLLLLPDWAAGLKPEAEALIQFREARESNSEISGLELGLRAGIFPQPHEWLELGLEIRAAETAFGERPDVVQLGGGFGNKGLGISQAYLAFLKGSEDHYELTFSLGKFYNPFLTTALTWDKDYRPEGLYQSLWWQSNRLRSRFKIHAGQWSLDRVGPDITNAQDLRRSYVFVQGAEWQFLYSRYARFKTAVQLYAYYDISERTRQLSIQRGNDGQLSPVLLSEQFLPLETVIRFESEPLGLELLLESSFVINLWSDDYDRSFYVAGQVGREWREKNFVGRLSFMYSEPNTQVASVLDNEWGYTNLRGGKVRIGFFPIDSLETSIEGAWIERLQASLFQDRLIQILVGVRYQFL